MSPWQRVQGALVAFWKASESINAKATMPACMTLSCKVLAVSDPAKPLAQSPDHTECSQEDRMDSSSSAAAFQAFAWTAPRLSSSIICRGPSGTYPARPHWSAKAMSSF
eukprot:5238082-Lingulodinium_polyedra.AAC.1